jgi:hypothetical protein
LMQILHVLALSKAGATPASMHKRQSKSAFGAMGASVVLRVEHWAPRSTRDLRRQRASQYSGAHTSQRSESRTTAPRLAAHVARAEAKVCTPRSGGVFSTDRQVAEALHLPRNQPYWDEHLHRFQKNEIVASVTSRTLGIMAEIRRVRA